MKKNLLLPFFLLVYFGIFAQQTSKVDFKDVNAQIAVLPSEGKVIGDVSYTFDVLQSTDSVFIDANNMNFSNVKLNGRKVSFYNNENRLWIIHDFKESKENLLELEYTATPEQAMYFVGWDEELVNHTEEKYFPQVWTQGQGRYTSNWLPSFDDTNEKAVFDLNIDFKKDFLVTANGKLLEQVTVNDSVTRWKFDMQEPMSSYLVAMAAGKYKNEVRFSSGGTPISLLYTQGNEEKVEPTYRYTTQIFDFLEQEIKVDYPWQNYKQIPVRDFLYAGMENTGTTIFSDAFVVDSVGFVDRNYVNVNAHELAHQWFGNLVTAASGEHHWLQEGFATYYALLAEKEIFGDDYFYWKLFESAEQLKAKSDIGEGESLLDPNASSLTFYQKGAWALHILKERIGTAAFNLAVENYLNQHKFENVTTQDFITEVEKASGEDLSGFVSDWLKQTSFPATEALSSLRESDFIQDYLQIAALKEVPLEDKKERLSRALGFPVNDYIGQEVVNQLARENVHEVSDLYKKAFETNNFMVRQAIAGSLTDIPESLKEEFESLLKDDSYLTKEIALYKLWEMFPEDREKYLSKLEGVEGFSDKNVEILWLALNLATPDYEPGKKSAVYNKLSGYTSPYYPYQIRQNALGYLFQLNSLNDQNLKDLLQGVHHQVSRFRQFSRGLLERLLQDGKYRRRLQELKEEFPKAQQEFLERKFKEEL